MKHFYINQKVYYVMYNEKDGFTVVKNKIIQLQAQKEVAGEEVKQTVWITDPQSIGTKIIEDDKLFLTYQEIVCHYKQKAAALLLALQKMEHLKSLL